jgi:hypothetical protein
MKSLNAFPDMCEEETAKYVKEGHVRRWVKG